MERLVHNFWLRCTDITDGMLPEEYAIEATTFDGQKISFFVSKIANLVRPENKLMRVDVLECNPTTCLVYLPATPFEVSSRFVSVSRGDLIEQSANSK